MDIIKNKVCKKNIIFNYIADQKCLKSTIE